MILSTTGRTIYNGYDVKAGTFVYTDGAGTGADDGWISTRYDNVSLVYGLGTLTATSLVFRIEGRSDGYSRNASIYAASLTSVSTIDSILAVTEPVKEIRVGVKCKTTVATPNNIYVGLVLRGKK